jgi:hypothetical protein
MTSINQPIYFRRHDRLRRCFMRKLIFSILHLMSLVPNMLSGDIYLAVRMDDIPGSGTLANPYDAGTATKLDSLLHQFTSNTNFHYAAGTYQTTGWKFSQAQTANPGCKHFGAGVDKTIVQLVNSSGGQSGGIIFGIDYNRQADGFELHDMTLDCNAPGNPQFTGGQGAVTAISVQGNNILLDNLKVTGFGTGKQGLECFPIFIFAGAGQSGKHYSNVRVTNCLFTQPATGNKDGLSCVVLGSDPGSLLDGMIEGCAFMDLSSDFTYCHAMYAAVCRNNRVQNCTEGVYLEPANNLPGNWIIQGNTFLGVSRAVTINPHPGSSMDMIIFDGNAVELSGPYNPSAALIVTNDGLSVRQPQFTVNSIVFTNNQVGVVANFRYESASLLLRSNQCLFSVANLITGFNTTVGRAPNGDIVVSSCVPVTWQQY